MPLTLRVALQVRYQRKCSNTSTLLRTLAVTLSIVAICLTPGARWAGAPWAAFPDRSSRAIARAVPTPHEETAGMEQTYLITGGMGFIGSHLAERLLEAGHTVVLLDDLSTGRLDNLSEIRGEPRLHVEVGSVLDDLKVDQLVHRCDVVVHLAAAVGVKLIVEQPLRSFTTNIRGSEIVIGAAHRYRRKILVVSTSEVYGKNGKEKLQEDADRVLGATSVARWAYSTAKAVDEILALMYHRERDLQSIV